MKILKQQFKIFKNARRQSQKPKKTTIKIEKQQKHKNNGIGNQTDIPKMETSESNRRKAGVFARKNGKP